MKRVFTVIFLCIADLAFTTVCNADEFAMSSGKKGIRVIKHSGGRFEKDRLIFALLEDGTLIWSTPSTDREDSHLKGHVEESVSETCIKELMLAIDDTTAQDYRVPDSEFISISVSDGKKKLELRSCHELFEQTPELVATSRGIRLLNNESRSKVLCLEPIEYVLFRLSWSEVRRKLQSLAMGSERIHIKGQIERRDGITFFRF